MSVKLLNPDAVAGEVMAEFKGVGYVEGVLPEKDVLAMSGAGAEPQLELPVKYKVLHVRASIMYSEVEALGERLSEQGSYLQHPVRDVRLKGLRYHNPHYLYRPGQQQWEVILFDDEGVVSN
jgi:hypothetical protein